MQRGSAVWAPQVNICTNVHKEAAERWKKNLASLQGAQTFAVTLKV